MTIKDRVFISLQYIAPQHRLSRLAGVLADTQIHWVKTTFISLFMRFFKVNMGEAVIEDPSCYPSFNAFFCRALKPDARQWDNDATTITSPADGCISAIGEIEYNLILQAKGHRFTTTALLGGNSILANQFNNGKFATIYLAPKDYHRVHMPIDGTLRSMTYIPGQLFSVNQTTAANVQNLFARNERVVCVFDTEYGPMAMVLVGAMIVGSIETIWGGQVAPPENKITTIDYQQDSHLRLKKGEEMGRFKLGSTVILLLPPKSYQWSEKMVSECPIKLGERLGETRHISAEKIKSSYLKTDTELTVTIEKISDDVIAPKGEGLAFHYGTGESPFGRVFIVWTDSGIHGLSFTKPENTDLAPFQTLWPKAEFLLDEQQAAKQIESIFAGKHTTPLTLWIKATDFQLNVWKQLVKIQAGQISHYKDIADAIGKPKAVRAVGNAIGANPVAFIIPCHRVIPIQDNEDRTHTVGGYRWGEHIKEALLRHEGPDFIEK